MPISKEFEKIIEAAKAGGEVIKNYFGQSLDIVGKTTPADFRTKADLESEAAILKILEHEFPNYNIFSEECGEINKNSDYTFIIDPLDGTNNFVLGIPNFGVGIGLMHKDETIFGVIYQPILGNAYYAEKGKGAYLDGKKLEVNKEADLKNSVISFVIHYDCPIEYETHSWSDLKSSCERVLANWSCLIDCCLLASGKMEAVLMKDIYTLYDFIPGKLIAREAGALITDLDGNPETNDKNTNFLITNGTGIHNEIIKIAQKNENYFSGKR